MGQARTNTQKVDHKTHQQAHTQAIVERNKPSPILGSRIDQDKLINPPP